jgi:hypothetical protein
MVSCGRLAIGLKIMNAFAEWLQKGLGRPAVYLKTQDAHALREALLHACTHNLAYDRQCEDSRAAYLLDLIELSGDTEFYHNGILQALKSKNDEQDQGQIFELSTSFAEKGDSEIKQSMYAAFERDGFELTPADELVRLDGLAGCSSWQEALALRIPKSARGNSDICSKHWKTATASRLSLRNWTASGASGANAKISGNARGRSNPSLAPTTKR